nr:siderophore-interacting protein [Nocardioides convexus]
MATLGSREHHPPAGEQALQADHAADRRAHAPADAGHGPHRLLRRPRSLRRQRLHRPLRRSSSSATRPSLENGGRPTLRTYTALAPDVAAGTLSIDFVVHGDEGIAGPWAAAAQPGDTIAVRGPGGAYAPDPAADWHLLAGDEAAIPAIRQALAALPADAQGYVVLQVDGASYQQDVEVPAGVEPDLAAPLRPRAPLARRRRPRAAVA